MICDRCEFHKRFQKEGESLGYYCIAIKQLTFSCDFKTFLKDVMRDRIVNGIRNQEIQQWLMTEDDKSFEELYALAVRLEKENCSDSYFQSNLFSSTLHTLFLV